MTADGCGGECMMKGPSAGLADWKIYLILLSVLAREGNQAFSFGLLLHGLRGAEHPVERDAIFAGAHTTTSVAQAVLAPTGEHQ